MAMTGHDFVVAAKAQIVEIGVADAAALLAQGGVALDVREGDEFQAGHIPGALHVARGVLEFKVGMLPQLADKAQPLVVYCKSGGRSALATYTLQQMGYSQLRSLAGGFDAWSGAGQAVDKPAPVSFE